MPAIKGKASFLWKIWTLCAAAWVIVAQACPLREILALVLRTVRLYKHKITKNYLTVIFIVALLLLYVFTVIIAVPFFTAVTFPFLFTLATFLFEEEYLKW